MSREEEIKKANPYELNEMMQDYAFKKGAKWADEHPSEETIAKLSQLYQNWLVTKEDIGSMEYIKQHWNDESKSR